MNSNSLTDLEQLLRVNIELSTKTLELLQQINLEIQKESEENLELQADLSVAKLDIDLMQLEIEEKAYELKQMEKEMLEKDNQIDCFNEEIQKLKEKKQINSEAIDRLSLMEQGIQNMKNSLICQSPP